MKRNEVNFSYFQCAFSDDSRMEIFVENDKIFKNLFREFETHDFTRLFGIDFLEFSGQCQFEIFF